MGSQQSIPLTKCLNELKHFGNATCSNISKDDIEKLKTLHYKVTRPDFMDCDLEWYENGANGAPPEDSLEYEQGLISRKWRENNRYIVKGDT